MRKASVSVLFLALVISPGIFATGNAEAGKDVFMKRCAACHAEDGSGKENIAKMMKVAIPPLASKDVQALSDDEIGKVITAGKNKMKPMKDLSSADVPNLIAFIRNLAKK
jgi:mono/diheme cytochrome c family protein